MRSIILANEKLLRANSSLRANGGAKPRKKAGEKSQVPRIPLVGFIPAPEKCTAATCRSPCLYSTGEVNKFPEFPWWIFPGTREMHSGDLSVALSVQYRRGQQVPRISLVDIPRHQRNAQRRPVGRPVCTVPARSTSSPNSLGGFYPGAMPPQIPTAPPAGIRAAPTRNQLTPNTDRTKVQSWMDTHRCRHS